MATYMYSNVCLVASSKTDYQENKGSVNMFSLSYHFILDIPKCAILNILKSINSKISLDCPILTELNKNGTISIGYILAKDK